ncbi:DUF6622 family protein [Rhodoferax saidenbachensis]|uniref:Tat pathway signal sequence n=1 Tax=Rhodoferax saidenbachensis TaxID=1484693 RepID=A0A1P8KC49_9BURK|nr:DUF6622 family protein [Rhodoferax saidenbachensis]APW43584.1 hypothetical protein RS694_14275 [Rhodoferax saidenbachensis]
MITQILLHTPAWVWGLLAVLLALGFTQTRSGLVGLPRITFMPLAMVALSAYGTVSAFGATPGVLLAWLVGAALLATFITLRPLPAGTRFDTATQNLFVPGSWTPMALILGIFCTKYFVGVDTALHPALPHDSAFTLGFAALYGAFSGTFAARAARLLRLALLERNNLSATPLTA